MSLKITLDKNRITYVDEKQFFLVGARHMPEGANVELLAKAGFNACRLLAFGNEGASSMPLPPIDSDIFFWSYIYDRAAFGRNADHRKNLERHILEVKNHPKFLCYENYNEIAWSYKNSPGKACPEELDKGMALLRQLDPEHPVWLAHSCERTIEALRKYNNCMDILGCNPYPVLPGPLRRHVGFRPDGYLTDCPDRTLHAVGKYTDKMIRVGEGQKPVWMLIQAMANESWFDPDQTPELAGQTIDESKILYPTYEQMRFMAYDAVIAGATGIAFSMHKTPVDGQEWQDITKLVRELRDMETALTAPPVNETVEISYQDLGYSIWDGVVTLMRQKDNDIYVFAANTAFDPAQVTMRIPKVINNGTAMVEVENRQLQVENSRISDYFQPYAVHIYKIKASQ